MPDQGEGARFGYLFPGSVIVGVDAVDLPEDAPRAWTRFEPWRICFSASVLAGAGSAAMAGEAAARGGCVAASVAGPRARGPQHRVPALFLGARAEGRPRARRPPRRILRHRASPLTPHPVVTVVTVAQALRNSLVRLELDAATCSFGDVALRCRFAGHYLPITCAPVRRECKHHRTVEVCVAPPKRGFDALRGAPFSRVRDAAAPRSRFVAQPIRGFPVPNRPHVGPPVVHAELRRALGGTLWIGAGVNTFRRVAGRTAEVGARGPSLGRARPSRRLSPTTARPPGSRCQLRRRRRPSAPRKLADHARTHFGRHLVGTHLPTLRAVPGGAPTTREGDEDYLLVRPLRPRRGRRGVCGRERV